MRALRGGQQLVSSRYRRLGGSQGAVLTAASAVTVIQALSSAVPCAVHAPGPLALIGGYPVQASAAGLEIDLPPGVTLEQAIEINEKAMWHDGIAEVRDDGSVRFSDPQMDIVSRMLGYDVREMKLTDSEACAEELGRRYAAFRQQFAA